MKGAEDEDEEADADADLLPDPASANRLDGGTGASDPDAALAADMSNDNGGRSGG